MNKKTNEPGSKPPSQPSPPPAGANGIAPSPILQWAIQIGVALLSGALGGLLTAYVAYQQMEVNYNKDLRTMLMENYQTEIAWYKNRKDDRGISAKERKLAKEKLAAISQEYEKFMEDFRITKKLEVAVNHLKKLPREQVATTQREQVQALLAMLATNTLETVASAKTLGDAWLVSGDYEKALQSLRIAQAQGANDPEVFTSKALAYMYLAQDTKDPLKSTELQNMAHENALMAMELSPKKSSTLFLPMATMGLPVPQQ